MWFQETFVRILLTKGQLNNHNGYPVLCISICLIYRIRFLFLSTSESSLGRFYSRNKTVTWGSNWIWLYPHCLPIFPPHCVYRVCACVSFWKAYDFVGKQQRGFGQVELHVYNISFMSILSMYYVLWIGSWYRNYMVHQIQMIVFAVPDEVQKDPCVQHDDQTLNFFMGVGFWDFHD